MASAPSMTTYLSDLSLQHMLGGGAFTPPATLFLGLATSCNAAGVVTGEPTIGQHGYARVQFSNVVEAITVTGSPTTSISVAGGTTTFPVGTIVAFATSGGTLPAPLVPATPYFVVGGSSSTIQVAMTPAGTAITITTNGSGTNNLVPAFGTAASGQIQNLIALTFPQDTGVDWGAMNIFIIVDAATAGNVWLYNAIAGATNIGVNQTPYFPATALTVGPMY